MKPDPIDVCLSCPLPKCVPNAVTCPFRREKTPEPGGVLTAENCAEMFARLLKERRMTRHRLAKEIGVGDATVENWVLGRNAPQLNALCLALDRLGCRLRVEKKRKPEPGGVLTAENCAEALARIMEERRMTYRKLAEKTGVSDTTIVNWTHGHSAPRLDALCLALDRLGYRLRVEEKKTGRKSPRKNEEGT